jgi:hypothetical protein
LFAAGQGHDRACWLPLRILAEQPELRHAAPTTFDPGFLEEVLRVESPVKTDFRLARRATTIGGVDIAAGTPVMLLNGAANRDPRRFECPAEYRIDRANAQTHIAFGRGNHACPGGPLARRGTSQPRTHPRPHARHLAPTSTWLAGRALRGTHVVLRGPTGCTEFAGRRQPGRA